MTSVEFERTPKTEVATVDLRQRLKSIWETEPGFIGWLSSVDHKQVGIRYIVTAFAFLLIGGIEALVMRLQLAQPNEHIVSPGAYDQLFSMHGLTMIFLYAMPILSGFSNYLFPLVLGSRDMAFPRLNMLSYWIYLASGIFIYVGYAVGAGANDGWYNFAPYSLRQFNPGMNQDFYALGMVFNGISTTIGAANFIVTFFRTRAPGMSINRVPIMVWGTLTASFANLLVVPCVSLDFFLLWLERTFNFQFFNPALGGKVLLWQHLFWMFGHPWVYAIVLPAMGFVNQGLPTFCRRPLVGYAAVVLATVSTMILGFGVWVHHMFATGLPPLSLAFFSGASIIIAVPSAVSIFAWVATIWTGRPVITTAFLFFASTIVLFVVGGVSGFMTGSLPVDWQLTETYFIVAHIHYVLLGINVFPVVGALYFWFPKFTGRLMNERLGKWNFWTMFAGFNIAFLPMHLTGLWGMPRRIYTYAPGMGWSALNMITTVGAFILAVGIVLLLVNIVASLVRGEIAGPNPWDSGTLEWSTPSPPPPYNFAVIPLVGSRYPLWEEQMGEGRRSVVDSGMVLDNDRETIGTTAFDGRPNIILKMPGDSIAPLLLALSLTFFFAGLLINLWWFAGLGVALCFAVLVYWLWPRSALNQTAGANNA